MSWDSGVCWVFVLALFGFLGLCIGPVRPVVCVGSGVALGARVRCMCFAFVGRVRCVVPVGCVRYVGCVGFVSVVACVVAVGCVWFVRSVHCVCRVMG